MSPKLQRIMREIERVKDKIAELQTALPVLEKQKTELENAEIVRVFRSVDVTPADFTAFIEAHRNKPGSVAPLLGPAPRTNTMEELNNDEA